RELPFDEPELGPQGLCVRGPDDIRRALDPVEQPGQPPHAHPTLRLVPPEESEKILQGTIRQTEEAPRPVPGPFGPATRAYPGEPLLGDPVQRLGQPAPILREPEAATPTVRRCETRPLADPLEHEPQPAPSDHLVEPQEQLVETPIPAVVLVRVRASVRGLGQVDELLVKFGPCPLEVMASHRVPQAVQELAAEMS